MAQKKAQLANRKQRQILKSIAPYILGIAIISAAILYVWIYSEVDNTLKEVEILQASIIEFGDDINILKDDIEYLIRVDVLTSRAKIDLGMVFTAPETIEIYIDEKSLMEN